MGSRKQASPFLPKGLGPRSSAAPLPPFAQGTLGALGARKLRLLCDGVGAPELRDAAESVFQSLCSWSDWPAGNTAPWPNDITDDGTPFEYSVAFDGGAPKVRFLWEAQRSGLGLDGSWAAGLELVKRLGTLEGVDLGRFHRVKELFSPGVRADARFSMWHGATLRPDGRAAFKVYFNPQIEGAEASRDLVQRAFGRLQMREALDAVLERLPARGHNHRFIFFSLDLSNTPDARVKLYMAHDLATVDSVESDLAGIPGYSKGDAGSWIRHLAGQEGPFDARPILSCFALTSATEAPAVTVYVPVRCYAPSDSYTVDRACELLGPEGAARLREGLRRMAGRPLEAGRGLVTYVAVRRQPAGLNVTVYVAPEIYAIGAPRPSEYPSEAEGAIPLQSMIHALRPRRSEDAPPATMADVDGEVSALASDLAEHPFLKRLESSGGLQGIRSMAARLTFFVLAFQDMLRLVHERTTDGRLKEVARVHALEDAGHHEWFLHDLRQLGVPLDLRLVYGSDHRATRDLSYEILSEVLQAQDDVARLAIVLSLEAAGHEFFGRVIGFLARIGFDGPMKYFARSHERVEQSHDVFESETHRSLAEMPLSRAALDEATRAARRTFAALTRLATHLEEAMGVAGEEHVA